MTDKRPVMLEKRTDMTQMMLEILTSQQAASNSRSSRFCQTRSDACRDCQAGVFYMSWRSRMPRSRGAADS
jgi:hypothetical protein